MLDSATMFAGHHPTPKDLPTLVSAEEAWESAAQVRVRVELRAGGRSLSSEVAGTVSEAGALRLAANATLTALREVLPSDVRLVGVKRIRAFDTKLIVAALRASGSNGHRSGRLHVGLAVVRGNTTRAVALAVMDALFGRARDRGLAASSHSSGYGVARAK